MWAKTKQNKNLKVEESVCRLGLPWEPGECWAWGALHAPESCPCLSPTVEGNSDELDEPIKAVFADVPFVKKHNLMSLNSINWSRVLVQMAHFFFAYFRCAPSLHTQPLPPVEVVVPTGAAGNLAGKETLGWYWVFHKYTLSSSSCSHLRGKGLSPGLKVKPGRRNF